MNLGNLASFITSRVGKSDADSLSACKDYIRARHEMIFDSDLWKDSLELASFNLPTRDTTDSSPYTSDSVETVYEQDFTLPYRVARPLGVIYNGCNLNYRELQTEVVLNPSTLNNYGSPLTYTEMEPRAISKRASEEPVRVQLQGYADSADNGVEVYFKGTTDDRPIAETMTLSANTQWGSVDFDEIHYVSKATTTGEVSFTVGAVVEDIPAEETKYSLARIRLGLRPQWVSGDTVPIIALGKRRIRPLRNDSDEPMIRGVDNALIAYVTGDMLERGRQYAKAQVKFSEGDRLLASLRNLERSQSGHVQLITPDSNGETTRYDFGW